MPRRGRGASRASARAAVATRRVSTQPDHSDTEMQDAPTEQSTPRGTDSANEDESVVNGDDAEDPEEIPTPSRSRTRQSGTPVIPAKRRGGRIARGGRTQDGDVSDADAKPAPETPKRGRGGFRGRGGGRWKHRQPQHVTQVAIDKEGTMANVKDDEIEMTPDPEGETKVDQDGYLQDGREYRVRTFSVAGKGRRLYMLSTEPARCIGFRDSYLFFQKHRYLYKTVLTDEAKHNLIDREVLPHSYKGRTIGVVTARSVFREFGAIIVVGGRKILDDYKAAEARANGDVEGELAVPDDVLPAPGEEYDRKKYVAWFGASSVYHSNAPSVPLQNGKPEVKKRRIPITDANWMVEHALAASRFNSQLREMRRESANGVYDIYTNQMHYPANMQPTHAKWEQLPPAEPRIKNEEDSSSPGLGPHIHNLSLRDGLPQFPAAAALTAHGPAPAVDGPAPGPVANDPASAPADGGQPARPPVSDWQYRNRCTIDYDMQFPRRSNLGPIGVDAGEDDFGPKGLCEVAEDVVALLPPDCLGPFLKAREEERKWRTQWSSETDDGLRAEPKITYAAI